MSKCSVCGNTRRAGTGGRVNLLDAAGQLRTVIACAACVGRSISIVTAPPASILVKESDDADVRKVLRGLARHLKGIMQAYEASKDHVEQMTWRDGIKQAADIAEAWAKERGARKPVAGHFVDFGNGWVCKACREFNSDEREICRKCAGPRLVESNVSHAPQELCNHEAIPITDGRKFHCKEPLGHLGRHSVPGTAYVWGDDGLMLRAIGSRST